MVFKINIPLSDRFSGSLQIQKRMGFLCSTLRQRLQLPLMLILSTLLTSIIVYVLAGMVIAPFLSFTQLHKIDPAAIGASLGFRLIILPGLVLLWPLISYRAYRCSPPPTERTNHKRYWSEKND